MRNPLVIGNWKLNGSTKVVSELIKNLRNLLSDSITGCDVVIAPPVLYLDQAKKSLAGSEIILGAQDVGINLSGAFTGDISAEMLKDVGVKYVIIGHSERRTYHKESDEFIMRKFSAIKEQGLIPVLCIGESIEEKRAGKTEEICMRQINSVLDTLGVSAFEKSVIAYEPIWAIGTGKSAVPAQAQVIHKFIRDHIAQHDPVVAEEVVIQYGGSVNVDNAVDFFIQPDIDGLLVGKTSLKSDAFSSIVKSAEKRKN